MSKETVLLHRGWQITADELGFSWEHGGPFMTADEARADIDERPADEPDVWADRSQA